MALTIELGWWMLPTALSVLSIAFLIFWKGFLADAGSNIGAQAISGLLDLLVAGSVLIINLIVWLIWALLR